MAEWWPRGHSKWVLDFREWEGPAVLPPRTAHRMTGRLGAREARQPLQCHTPHATERAAASIFAEQDEQSMPVTRRFGRVRLRHVAHLSISQPLRFYFFLPDPNVGCHPAAAPFWLHISLMVSIDFARS
jgi:hypothetical protein